MRRADGDGPVPEDAHAKPPASQGIGLKHLGFQGVPALDVDRAIRFWTEAFGLELVEDKPHGVTRWVMFDIGGAQTRLVLMPMAELPVTDIPALVFSVEDLAGTLSRLEARGVKIRRGIRPAEWDDEKTSALVEDSEGNVILLASDEAP